MSESYKSMAEKKHKMICNFLVKNFPGCDVKYNGLEGVDYRVIFNDHVIYIEGKSCKRIVKSSVRPDPVRPVLHQEVRIGRFKFDNRNVYPYEPLSQHSWLVDKGGWYVFMVGYSILGSLQAKDVPVNPDFDKHWISWLNILSLCHPDWLDQLKKDVYISQGGEHYERKEL